MRTRTAVRAFLMLTLLTTAIACDSQEPGFGDIVVRVVTEGGDIDPMFDLVVDGESIGQILADAPRQIPDVATGAHEILLRDVAANCELRTSNPVRVTVVRKAAAEVRFTVACVATGIEVDTRSTGPDPDDAYIVSVQPGGTFFAHVNGVTAITRLSPGTYEITLNGVADNCTIESPNPQTAIVVDRTVVRLDYDVRCVAATGDVRVIVATSGDDVDPNGYTVHVGERAAVHTTPGGEVTVTGIPPGEYDVRLGDAATNCAIGGPNPRRVSVSAGTPMRHTVVTTFEVTCAPAAMTIAYASDMQVALLRGDSTNIVVLGFGSDPSWSPDGARVAFNSMICDDYYAQYYGCYSNGLHVMNADGTERAQLTDQWSDANAAWHPDGTRIAFTRDDRGQARLHIVQVELGAGPIVLLTPTFLVAMPAWSPDGSALAFTCEVAEANLDICVVNADGTGFRRLTTDRQLDTHPSWSPDGAAIAFTTWRYDDRPEIAVMAVDGTNVTRLRAGTLAQEPAWSTDGRIAFARLHCGTAGDCSSLGLSVVNADGTGLASLTKGADYAPAWRP